MALKVMMVLQLVNVHHMTIVEKEIEIENVMNNCKSFIKKKKTL